MFLLTRVVPSIRRRVSEELAERQGGLCGSCGEALLLRRWARHLDHCHATGELRALLCRQCNIALGVLGENPEKIRRLADYAELCRAHATARRDPT